MDKKYWLNTGLGLYYSPQKYQKFVFKCKKQQLFSTPMGIENKLLKLSVTS